MTDTAEKKASDATWAVPLALLTPAVLIRLFTDMEPFWRTSAWIFWGLSVLLVLAAWVQVVRHGARGATGWGACGLVHAVLLWDGIRLAAL